MAPGVIYYWINEKQDYLCWGLQKVLTGISCIGVKLVPVKMQFWKLKCLITLPYLKWLAYVQSVIYDHKEVIRVRSHTRAMYHCKISKLILFSLPSSFSCFLSSDLWTGITFNALQRLMCEYGRQELQNVYANKPQKRTCERKPFCYNM